MTIPALRFAPYAMPTPQPDPSDATPPLAGPWRPVVEENRDPYGRRRETWFVCAGGCPDVRVQLSTADAERALFVAEVLNRLYPPPAS